MANKKRKKGSALIGIAIFLFIVAIAAFIASPMMGAAGNVDLAAILYVTAAIAFVAAWPLLTIGIIVAIVRAVKNKRAEREEQEQAKRGSSDRNSNQSKGGLKLGKSGSKKDTSSFKTGNVPQSGNEYLANPEIKEQVEGFLEELFDHGDISVYDFGKASMSFNEIDEDVIVDALNKGDIRRVFLHAKMAISESANQFDNRFKGNRYIAYPFVYFMCKVMMSLGMVETTIKVLKNMYDLNGGEGRNKYHNVMPDEKADTALYMNLSMLLIATKEYLNNDESGAEDIYYLLNELSKSPDDSKNLKGFDFGSGLMDKYQIKPSTIMEIYDEMREFDKGAFGKARGKLEDIAFEGLMKYAK